MSYIVYIADVDSTNKIQILGIFKNASKARECLYNGYSEKYLSNSDKYQIKVVGDGDVAIYKINQGYFSNYEDPEPFEYYRIVKYGSNGLATNPTVAFPSIPSPPNSSPIKTGSPVPMQGLPIDISELKAQISNLKPIKIEEIEEDSNDEDGDEMPPLIEQVD